MRTTLIPALYTDRNQYRTWGQLIAPGTLSGDQADRLRSHLHRGIGFVPEQVGMRHLGWLVPNFVTFPNPVDDHAWHDLMVEHTLTLSCDDPQVATGTRFASVEVLLEVFATAAADGWSPASFDPCVEVSRDRSRDFCDVSDLLVADQLALPGLG